MNPSPPQTQSDFYIERGCIVFTAAYLLRRGTCCGNGCRHCPFKDEPSALAAGSPTIDAALTVAPTNF